MNEVRKVEYGPPRKWEGPMKMRVENVDAFYGKKQALKSISLDIPARAVTALIGPSGCGKSTLLRCLNRMNDQKPDFRMTGLITLEGEDIYDPQLDTVQVRKRFGWVNQKPDPFPWSIYKNVAWAPRIHGLVNTRSDSDEVVIRSLKRVGLWKEVEGRLQEPGTSLSGGQQQRLCIARALAYDPEVLLMDEPCSSLDPISTSKIEELIVELRADYTVVIITHEMNQAARVAQRTAFFHLGELVEEGPTEQIMHHPDEERTLAYVTGRYG